jgi:large subunit ribosomal protein L25
MSVTLAAQKRDTRGKGAARKLREGGRVPAVLYGRELETLHVSVSAHEAEHLFRSIPVDNTIVDLKVEGVKEAKQTLVREIQAHPWKNTLVHIDFLRIQQGVAVDVDIPVNLIGTPQGVKDDGGVLEHSIHDLPVRCVPSMIPESIDVDVSHLGLNDVLHVSDLKLPEGVEVRIPGERTICSVAVPRVSEEPQLEVEGVEVEGEAGAAPAEAGDDEDAGDSDDD